MFPHSPRSMLVLATSFLCSTAARIPPAQVQAQDSYFILIPATTTVPTPAAKSHKVHLPDSLISDLSSERVCIDTGIGDCESASKPYLPLNVSVNGNDELFVNNERVFPLSIPPRLHALRKWTDDSTTASDNNGDNNNKAERVILTYALGIRPLAIDEISSTTEDGWIIRVEFFDMHARRATPNVIRVELERENGGKRGLVISKIVVHPLYTDWWGGRPKRLPWEARYWRIKNDGQGRNVADQQTQAYKEEYDSTGVTGRKPPLRSNPTSPTNTLKDQYVHDDTIQQQQQLNLDLDLDLDRKSSNNVKSPAWVIIVTLTLEAALLLIMMAIVKIFCRTCVQRPSGFNNGSVMRSSMRRERKRQRHGKYSNDRYTKTDLGQLDLEMRCCSSPSSVLEKEACLEEIEREREHQDENENAHRNDDLSRPSPMVNIRSE